LLRVWVHALQTRSGAAWCRSISRVSTSQSLVH
jgi:hypothetical protein